MNWQERAEKAEAELARLREQERERCAQLCEWLPVGTGYEGKTFAEAIRGNGIGGRLADGFIPSFRIAEPVPAVAAPAVPDGMMLVMAQDANNYCRILTLLGMEEEGDPVGAVSTMLQSTQTVPEECQHCKKAWEMAPVAWYRRRSDGGVDGPLMDDDSRMCAVRRKEWNPLYERPFYPDFLNYRQGFNDGIEEIRYELKQLCKDFSDLQNRPYMGDVHAQVDAICERALLQSAEVTK